MAKKNPKHCHPIDSQLSLEFELAREHNQNFNKQHQNHKPICLVLATSIQGTTNMSRSLKLDPAVQP